MVEGGEGWVGGLGEGVGDSIVYCALLQHARTCSKGHKLWLLVSLLYSLASPKIAGTMLYGCSLHYM